MYKTIPFSGLLLALAFGGPILYVCSTDCWKLASGKAPAAKHDKTGDWLGRIEAFTPWDKFGTPILGGCRFRCTMLGSGAMLGMAQVSAIPYFRRPGDCNAGRATAIYMPDRHKHADRVPSVTRTG